MVAKRRRQEQGLSERRKWMEMGGRQRKARNVMRGGGEDARRDDRARSMGGCRCDK